VQTYKEVGPKADSAYDLNGGCVLVPKAQAGVNDGVGTFNGYFTKAQNGEVSFRSAVELGGFQHTGVFSPQPGRCDGTPADTYCWRTGAVDGGLQGLPSHVQLGRTGTVTDPTKARAKDGLGSWLFSIKKGKASMTCTGGAVVIVTPTTTSWTNAQGPCVASF
jgi:hypothetical protein